MCNLICIRMSARDNLLKCATLYKIVAIASDNRRHGKSDSFNHSHWTAHEIIFAMKYQSKWLEWLNFGHKQTDYGHFGSFVCSTFAGGCKTRASTWLLFIFDDSRFISSWITIWLFTLSVCIFVRLLSRILLLLAVELSLLT